MYEIDWHQCVGLSIDKMTDKTATEMCCQMWTDDRRTAGRFLPGLLTEWASCATGSLCRQVRVEVESANDGRVASESDAGRTLSPDGHSSSRGLVSY